MDDSHWMSEALREAHRAAAQGDVPVGALVVLNGTIIGRGHNRREIDGNPLAHAELMAMQQASEAIEGWRLTDCTLYVTLEPCAMCAGALVNSRIDTLVFGTRDPKAGFCGSVGNLVAHERLNHRLTVRQGVLQEECSEVLKSFFRELRDGRRKKSSVGKDL